MTHYMHHNFTDLYVKVYGSLDKQQLLISKYARMQNPHCYMHACMTHMCMYSMHAGCFGADDDKNSMMTDKLIALQHTTYIRDL